MEDATKVTLVNTANIANPTQFLPVLNDLLSNISTRVVNDPSLGMFATEKTKFMGSQCCDRVCGSVRSTSKRIKPRKGEQRFTWFGDFTPISTDKSSSSSSLLFGVFFSTIRVTTKRDNM